MDVAAWLCGLGLGQYEQAFLRHRCRGPHGPHDRTNVTRTATLCGATVNASFAAGTDVARQYTILHAADGVTGTFGTEVNTNLPTNFHTALSYDGNNAHLNLILNFAVPSGKKLIESRSGTRVNFLHRHFTDFGDTRGTQLFLCCRCKSSWVANKRGRSLQPSPLAECRKINSRRSIPTPCAVTSTELQSDLLVPIRNS